MGRQGVAASVPRCASSIMPCKAMSGSLDVNRVSVSLQSIHALVYGHVALRHTCLLTASFLFSKWSTKYSRVAQIHGHSESQCH
jgi:hypothetical protein